MKHCCPKNFLKFFKSICDDHRQKILSLLRDHGTMNVSEIVKKIHLSQPTISHHLKILHDAHVIDMEKKGKEIYYKLTEKSISDCCQGFVKWFHKR